MDVTSYILGKKAAGGGGGGTTNYNELSNKPQINSVELSGNKALADLGIQSEITSTHKLDASFIDDSLSTNKFVTSAEKTAWSGKQDLLTAGSGIDITNNVISALGGANVYFIEDNSQENPFILSKHDVGIYHFNSRTSDGSFNVYFKAKENSGSVTSTSFYPNSIFMYNNKIEEDETLTTITTAGRVWNIFVNKVQKSLAYGNLDIQVKTNDNINFYNETFTNNLSFINLAETISAKKTFSVLPESSVVPTTDDQLVNKKYVDDNAGGSIPENLKVYYNSGNANDVDFIFDENETGIYFLGINTGNLYGQRNINFYATNNSNVLRSAIGGIGYLLYTTKYTGEETTKQIYGYLVDLRITNTSVKLEIKKIEIDVNSDKSITSTIISTHSMSSSSFVTLNDYQQINAIKVFNMVPQCSLTPTNDNNLTNKKYVDDKPTTYDGYDATKTQVLKNINGTLTWVDE